MKVQTLYEASHDGVTSGQDLQEFFMDVFGYYSVSGYEDVDTEVAKEFLYNCLRGQLLNSPNMEEWVNEMGVKYELKQVIGRRVKNENGKNERL